MLTSGIVGLGQDAPAPAGQQGQQGQRGQGQRGGQRGPAAPAAPTPRRPDGKPWIGSVPGQKPGRWMGGPTTLPLNMLDKVPFQQWARAVYNQRQIDQFEPHTRCKASGVSRQFSTPYGTEFVDVPDVQRIYIMDMGGPNSYRIIYMDGRSHPATLTPTNYGHSIGHWEGDTLVVETIGLNEKFWIDTRGTPHTEKLKFTERFTRTDMRLHYRRLHFVRILRGNEHKKHKKHEILCVFCALCVPDFQATIAYSLVSSASASTSSIDFTG